MRVTGRGEYFCTASSHHWLCGRGARLFFFRVESGEVISFLYKTLNPEPCGCSALCSELDVCLKSVVIGNVFRVLLSRLSSRWRQRASSALTLVQKITSNSNCTPRFVFKAVLLNDEFSARVCLG